MSYKSEALINPSGRTVNVATHRVEGLLEQGFKMAPKEGKSEASDTDPADVDYDDMTKAQLWSLVKERKLDEGVSYSDSSSEDLIAVLDAAE